MSKISCTLSLRDESGKYYINTYVTLLSIFENTSSSINVHIIHDETIAHAKYDLEQLSAKYGHKINFHHIPKIATELSDKISNWFNISAIYRLYAHELISDKKTIYLDSDIIAQKNIQDVADIDLSDKLVAAVKDHNAYWTKTGICKKKYREKVNYLGLTAQNYFNSGVTVLNLEECRNLSRTGNIFIKKIEECLHNGIPLHYPDQDVLNAVCAARPGSILMLDDSFNYTLSQRGRLYEGPEQLKNKIVHYVGGKPWDILFPAQLLFWKYYLMSPWRDDIIAQMDKVFHNKRMNIFKCYVMNPRHRRHAEDLLEGGIKKVVWSSIKKLFL